MKITQTKVVYTVAFGNYDNVAAVNSEWDCDFVCFTDNPSMIGAGWQVVIVQLDDESPATASRRIKILPHKLFTNYQISLYVDGNIKIVADPSPLFEKYLEKGLSAIPTHPDRNCAYKEAHLCINMGLSNKEVTEKQMAKYEADGLPKNNGMTANGIMFRRHNDENIIRIMESWFKEYCRGGKRDQLSLSYLIWKYKIDVLEVIEGAYITNKYFKIGEHEIQKSQNFINRLVVHIVLRKKINYFYLVLSKVIYLTVIIKKYFR